MLAELHLENLLLIERAHLEFGTGLNVFTGETGAGKSLLIDALGLLFGGRGDPDWVRPGAERAEVTVRFLIHDPDIVRALAENVGIAFETPGITGKRSKRKRSPTELVVSRSVPRTGRTRAHANGRPIAVAGLKLLAEGLLDIHGQHENQSLLRSGTRLEILDRFANAGRERDAVRKAWEEARGAAEALCELRRNARDRQGREDVLRFQLKELEDARLDEIEPEQLDSDLKLLRAAEQIRLSTGGVADALDGEGEMSAAALIARALRDMERLGDVGDEARELTERLDGLLTEARDLARDMSDLAERAQSDPVRLAEMEDARARLRLLERKHGRDLPGLTAMRDELRQSLAELGQLEVRFEEREKALEQAVSKLRSAATKLTRKRKTAAKSLEKRTASELKDLGLRGAVFSVRLEPHEGRGSDSDAEVARMLPDGFRATGAERIELLFSANPELPPKPLTECASGGELSRVMLALKGVLAREGGADRLPVVVFDEVDTGVGGRTGSVLGRKLAGLAEVRQVLCVTHLPQVAAYAEQQIKVEKRRRGSSTSILVSPIDGDGRVDELAMMLRGSDASEHTRAEAIEMLKVARKSIRGSGRKKRKGSR